MADGPQTTMLGKLVMIVFIIGCAYGAWYFFGRTAPHGSAGSQSATPGADAGAATGAAPATAASPSVQIGIAYGTEKERWLQWAVQNFATTDAGKGVTVNLIPMGSLEGAQALVRGDTRIDAWTPASSLYKETFVADWTIKYGNAPIVAEDQLALTPMVFVWWKERFLAFSAKHPEPTFANVALGLAERGGWDALAGHADWGLFKFGHTNPNESNSGLVTLLLMAYEYQHKDRDLQMKDILDTGFQGWMAQTEAGVSSMPNSTGNLMKEMVLKGPSAFDAVFVYESVAIDYLKNAEGRWGELQLVYPKVNMWNDNPFYIIDASWSTPAQRQGCKDFLTYLMSEPVQREALVHGFRPGNPNVGVRFPGSPFEEFQKYGLRNDLSAIAQTPKSEVMTNLLASWQRAQGSR